MSLRGAKRRSKLRDKGGEVNKANETRISGDSGDKEMATRKRPLELLKECLGEIAKLRGRGYDEPESSLWYDKVKAILEGAFTQADCRKFLHSWPTYDGLGGYASQKEYVKFLKNCETDLKWIIQKYEIRDKLSSEGERALPLQLFNAMHFHSKVVNASKSLFETRHYSQAIFEAFKAVNNFIKQKTGLSLDGKDLMAKVFREEDPIIKLNKLQTQSDKDEQEGFMFLFMGAMVGIRNPKAHDNVIQTDPSRTLEYLALASILMKRVEEGILVKTSPPRKQWNLQRFLIDASEKCSKEVVDTISKLYDFTKKYSDSISWGTGAHWGSFTFRKSWHGIKASIFTVYSDSSLSVNFGQMLGRGIEEEALESLRIELNRIPDIKISRDAVPNGKYPDISVDPFVNIDHLNKFQEAILSFCLKLESTKEKT